MIQIYRFPFLLYVICLLATTAARAQSFGFEHTDYKPNTVIFKLLPEHRTALTENGPKNYSFSDAVLQRLCEAQGAFTVKLLYPHHRGRKAGLVDLSLVGEIQFADAVQVPGQCRQLMATGKLAYAEPRVLFKKDNIARVEKHEDKPAIHPPFIPNDSLVGEQWHLGIIQAFDAWEIEQGDTSIVIGIVDDGVDYLHPDLAANIAINHADPVNGIDDDNNGFTDDYFGWDFYYSDNNPAPAGGHGTGVAGMASAVTNNGIGLAAPGYNSRVLAIKCSSDDPDDTNITYGFEGIVYAADRGCRIINCSWGGNFGYTGIGYLADILRYATFDKNALVIAAAGNNNNDIPFYPAYAPYVVGVAAVGPADVKRLSSNFSHLVDIAAQSIIWAPEPGGFYFSTFAGTSAASPVVAGAAALLAAHDPSLSALQLGERLRLTADNIDAQNPDYVEQLGGGRLNMYRALTDSPTPGVRFTEPVFTDGNDNIFTEGDTVRLSGAFVNYLADANDLVVTLSSPNTGISFLNHTLGINSLPSLAEENNAAEPFSFIVGPGIPPDEVIYIRLSFEATAYSDWQWVSTKVNSTYRNINTGVISSTIFSNGNIGYSNLPGAGIGVVYYPGSQLDGVYSLMLGSSSSRVSDAALNNPGLSNIFAEDFKTVEPVHPFDPPIDADIMLTCAYNDSALFLPLYRMDLSVRQNVYAWEGDHFFISTYDITNNNANTYSNFYAGLWSDLYVFPWNQNKVEQAADLNLAYMYCATANKPYMGIQVLGPGPFNLYAIEITPDFGSIDVTNTFSTAEKYTTLTQSRPAGGFGDDDGDDVSMVVSTGPHQLTSGSTLKVAFAILVADSLEALRTAAANALIRYDQLSPNTTTTETGSAPPLNIFPNPTGDMIWIETKAGINSRPVYAEVFDLSGKRIAGLSPAPEGRLWSVSTAQLPAGLYVLRVQTEWGVQTGKFVKAY